MDIVDNSASPGDRRGPAPRTGRARRPDGGGLDEPVPSPGDGGSGAEGHGQDTAASATRGSDLAREALQAAREQSARKAAERKAEGLPKLKVVSGRGRRRRWSGSGPDDRDPQPFGRIVSRVSMDRGWSPRLTDATVIGRWPQLVGPDVSDHCTPVSLRDGELVVQAESTAWATQLRTLQRQLLARLSAAVGRDVVRRIRVVGPSGPTWRHGPRTVRGRGPRDTYG